MSGDVTRPDRRTRTLPNGDVVREAGDCRFVSSPSGTVHERSPCEHDEYDYEYHPQCGTRLPSGSLWGSVDADTAEEAVMRFNLMPCTRCIDDAYRLERWRKDAHSALVMGDVGTPERWLQ